MFERPKRRLNVHYADAQIIPFHVADDESKVSTTHPSTHTHTLRKIMTSKIRVYVNKHLLHLFISKSKIFIEHEKCIGSF